MIKKIPDIPRQAALWLLLIIISVNAHALSDPVSPSLALIADSPDAEQIARQVYFVDHFYAFNNLLMGYKTRNRLVLLSQSGKRPFQMEVERLINHQPEDSRLKTQDLVLFRTGKLRGTGILVTDYQLLQPMQIRMWIPSLRKIRRFSEPDHNDIWGGSHLTYGDLYLRRPSDETHQLIDGRTKLECLGDASSLNQWARSVLQFELPVWCETANKSLYLIKSTPRVGNDDYDYRLRWIDVSSFAEYQVEYFRNDTLVKRTQKNWHSTELDDPRAQIWNFWTVKVFDEGAIRGESIAWINDEDYRWNQPLAPRLWSEQALKKIRR